VRALWLCPKCGARNSNGRDVCWSCYIPRPGATLRDALHHIAPICTILVIAAVLFAAPARAAPPAFVGNGDNHWSHSNEDCSRTTDVLASYTVGNETTPLLTLETAAVHYSTTTATPCPTSVTDNNGGVWKLAYTNPGCGCGATFYSENHPAGATVITVNWSAGAPISANQCGYVGQLSEVSGVVGSGSLDQTATAANAVLNPQASGTTAPTLHPVEWAQVTSVTLNSLANGFGTPSNGYTYPTCTGCFSGAIQAAAGGNTICMSAVSWKALSSTGSTNSNITGFGGGTYFCGIGGIATFNGQDSPAVGNSNCAASTPNNNGGMGPRCANGI
jgi:hypothetical protein